MGLREIIQNLGERQRERKEKIRLLDEEIRLQKLVQDRMKSANERELERFMEEDRQENIKKMLEVMRKKRQQDINFNHNPLNTPNIMKAKWEVLKEKNMFKKTKSSILNQEFIHKDNPNLFRNNRRLFNI